MEWRELAELRLRDMSERTSHPYVLLENWVGELPQRERLIFTARLATPEGRPTLQELGGKLGITRERVRQLEKQLYAELRTHLGTRAGRPIRWRIDTIRRLFGIAVPVSRAEPLLAVPTGYPDFSSLFLILAGPYVASDAWLILQ